MNRTTTLSAASAAHLADWYLKECGEDQAECRQWSLRAFPFTINRLPEASLQINHGSISKRHAEIGRDDSRLFVEDCGSTNGTFVNGKRLSGRVEAARRRPAAIRQLRLPPGPARGAST